MESNVLNELFLDISNVACKINIASVGSLDIDNLNKNILNRFLKYSLNLFKRDLDEDIIEMELQYEISRICIRKDIDDDTLKGLYIIKALIYSINDCNYDKILTFADNYVSDIVYKNIYEKFYGKKEAVSFGILNDIL